MKINNLVPPTLNAGAAAAALVDVRSIERHGDALKITYATTNSAQSAAYGIEYDDAGDAYVTLSKETANVAGAAVMADKTLAVTLDGLPDHCHIFVYNADESFLGAF